MFVSWVMGHSWNLIFFMYVRQEGVEWGNWVTTLTKAGGTDEWQRQGCYPDGARIVTGRMRWPISSHRNLQFFVLAADAHVLRLWSSRPRQKHMPHTIFQFHMSTSLPENLHLESCWPRHLIHIGSRFQALDCLESRKKQKKGGVLVLIINA